MLPDALPIEFKAASDLAGAGRAKWLAELAASLSEAQVVAVRLRWVSGKSDEARELERRIAAAKAELESLRRGDRWQGQELGSKWIGLAQP